MNGILLRLFEEQDFGVMKALRADIDAQHLLMAHPQIPVTDESVRQWLTRRHSEVGGLFRVVSNDTNQAMGFVQIADVHRLDGHGWLGVCIAREARGRRVGDAAVRKAMAIARSALGLRKLLLQVRHDNEVALQLYRRLGFRNIGRLSEHYIESPERAFDVLLFERFLSDVTAP